MLHEPENTPPEPVAPGYFGGCPGGIATTSIEKSPSPVSEEPRDMTGNVQLYLTMTGARLALDGGALSWIWCGGQGW